MATLTVAQAADALRAAGWPAAVIPIMVGIGRAESGLRVDAQSPPNRNGTIDRGWLQINSVHHYDPTRLLSDPVYTAQAALTIYQSQGLKAWSTYNSGAYKIGVPDAAATAAPAGAQPGTRLAAPVATVENVGLSDAVAGAGEQVATAVQPFAYRALLLAAAAGLVMVGLVRATKRVLRAHAGPPRAVAAAGPAGTRAGAGARRALELVDPGEGPELVDELESGERRLERGQGGRPGRRRRGGCRGGCGRRRHPARGRRGGTVNAAQTAIAFAASHLGDRYLWGGTGPNRWDCSGLTQAACRAAGVSIPRVAAAQYAALPHVPVGQAQPGDLLFMGKTPALIHHVVIYVGGGRCISAPKTGDVVKYVNVSAYSDLLPTAARPFPAAAGLSAPAGALAVGLHVPSPGDVWDGITGLPGDIAGGAGDLAGAAAGKAASLVFDGLSSAASGIWSKAQDGVIKYGAVGAGVALVGIGLYRAVAASPAGA